MSASRLVAGFAAAAIVGCSISGCALLDDPGVAAEPGLTRSGSTGTNRAQEQAAVPPADSVLSESAATGGLLIELPRGFTLTFEPVAGLDPDEQAALTDAAVLFAAWYQAIGRGNVDDPLFARYAAGRVLADMRDVVAMFHANGWTVRGSVLVNARTVHVTGDAAKVSWCTDLRDAYPMERSTGHVLRSPSGSQSFVLYSATLRRSEAGIWIATSMSSKRAAQVCLRAR